MRACAVDAINTAQSIGMHRWDQYPHSNPVLLGLWKRIWWTCFNRDIGVAVAHGLPCMINMHDFDVHPVTPEDFIEEIGMQADTQAIPYAKQEIVFYIEQTKVMETLRVINEDYYAKDRLQQTTTGLITEREESRRIHPALPGIKVPPIIYQGNYHDRSMALINQWLERTPSIVAYDVDDVQGHQFWPAFLHILFL